MVEGDNYPPPPVQYYLSQLLNVLKLSLIVLIVASQNPFEWINKATPSAYSWALENKVYACLMIFFLSNAIEGQLISTGAFEITFNDVPVWSKLESGRIPAPQEMFQIIENNMRLNQ
ncbi:hypothetical protein NP493_1868g00004 [Ridgeia piscesae]|uniref:Selenoprotein T n=1 Tax=Ridgeia piscesae TaxID=27915 RepID=A0AAD9N593_RIDPI|nr:hypothetical protein NP493_1868g00004 [Ridgeia piscesae]